MPVPVPVPVPDSISAPVRAPSPHLAIPVDRVLIPAGFFLMGSQSDGPEEKPLHEVAVASFELDRTEVTVAAYRACVDAGACARPHEGPFCNVLDETKDKHPENCIDATMADAFCTFAAGRLPTEEEWEYVARGGAERRKYAWGNEPPDKTRACYDHPGTCPVASFAAGAFGLFDVSGNVWEWTSSWFAPYPEPAESGDQRVYRGGSWSRRFPRWLATGLRNRWPVTEWSAAIGARCARSLAPLTCPDDAEPREQRCVRARGDSLLAKLGGGDRSTVAAFEKTDDNIDQGPATESRSPDFDADCAKFHPKTPTAFMLRGGSFAIRNTMLNARGCVRRDVGNGYTGVCCR